MYLYVLITNMQKLSILIDQLANWSKFKLRYEFSFFDIMMYSYVHITKMQKVSILIDQVANWSKLKLM